MPASRPGPPSAAPAERKDAARNKQRILAAAARMVAGGEGERLALDKVAREAHVGVGTVYRHYGDRAGLVYALLAEQDHRFREQVTAAGPPFGPPAAPGARLRAFLHALVDLAVEQRRLLVLADATSPGARYESDSYHFQRAHLGALLAHLRPGADTSYLADALLAPFAPSLITRQVTHEGRTARHLKAGVDQLLRGVLPEGEDGGDRG
jgi:AcrR family transcriptional regulator